ncbi:NAD(P)-dependent oxidoreductase [Acidisoma cellulosilytica]|uniref:NAD(P)-dependent oxidoreductase n=1 Tax=Acidisoma cellulosilyticum TaxID=2802395 RepID=A0A963YXH0_9PROT|nr:NAD(P)-dependent oxidoreductase [Acidisoma cellulosilyticum]MCB8878869.1 NAD(P)-dependent oxidoreductase [Acidisoma cellulosilyticum]
MNIAILGCGEVGLLYARAFSAAGHRILCCDPNPRPAATAFCAEFGLPLFESVGPWLQEAEAVMSCVFGSLSLSLAEAALPHMRTSALFADMTTCDPDDIRLAARAAAERGPDYADIAIMGAIALSGLKTSLLAAGTGSAMAATIFASIDAPIKVIDGVAGDAAAIKILRSIFTKGVEALAVECLLAAQENGVMDRLFDALGDIDANPLRETLEAFVRTHAVHAPRRLKEVEEAERQLHKVGLPSDVLPGVRARFQRTCDAMTRGPIGIPNPTANEALAWLRADIARDASQDL